jgi:hypothetical protein
MNVVWRADARADGRTDVGHERMVERKGGEEGVRWSV